MDSNVVVTIIVAIFASTGFWSFLSARFQSRANKSEDLYKASKVQSKMLKGLGHDRIINLCTEYIAKGYVTKDEYEDLHDYLYEPYVELGGNGTAKKMMEEVNKLPVKED